MNFISLIIRACSLLNDEWQQLPYKTKFGVKTTIPLLLIMFIATGVIMNWNPHHEYNVDLTIHDLTNKSIVYDANILMNTTIFAVDEPIDVSATVRTVQGTPPKIVYVLFDGSHLLLNKSGYYTAEQIQPSFGHRIYGGKVDAKLQSDNLYVGTATLFYDMDGCYDIKITAYPQLVNNQPFNQSRTCNLIHIQSSEATNLDIYNKAILITAIFSVSLASFGVASLFRDIFTELKENEDKYRHTRTKPDPSKN